MKEREKFLWGIILVYKKKVAVFFYQTLKNSVFIEEKKKRILGNTPMSMIQMFMNKNNVLVDYYFQG